MTLFRDYDSPLKSGVGPLSPGTGSHRPRMDPKHLKRDPGPGLATMPVMSHLRREMGPSGLIWAFSVPKWAASGLKWFLKLICCFNCFFSLMNLGPLKSCGANPKKVFIFWWGTLFPLKPPPLSWQNPIYVPEEGPWAKIAPEHMTAGRRYALTLRRMPRNQLKGSLC